MPLLPYPPMNVPSRQKDQTSKETRALIHNPISRGWAGPKTALRCTKQELNQKEKEKLAPVVCPGFISI